MKFDRQQKITAFALAALFLLFFGALLYLRAEVKDVAKVDVVTLATSTPETSLSSDGWWTSIPTDPSLPSMPSISLFPTTPTITQTATPSNTVIPASTRPE